MPYRVEESKNARASCKNTECKNAGVKIQKGELRFATQVTIQDHTSWAYKHWGCVTPAQVANLVEESGGDTDMVDGYEELPAELQEKVDFALQNGHVPDEDWKGDIECNRPGQKGFRLTAAQKKKKAKKDAEDDEDAPKPKAKRGRANKGDDDDEAPAPKKARGKGKKTAAKEEDDEDDAAEKVEAPKPKRGRKAAPKKEVEEDDAEEPEPPKGKRGRKAVPKEDVDEDDTAEEPEPPKAKRGRKAAADKAAPQKRSGRKKAAVNYEEE
ncbi:zf-PARP-domain-containing protein [Karstenula rhodostoma CBS 690.94]|uniref:Zf-PARP-domain-containing protein n=1 Tax=Karstenula rhodostoma CBS 690.94 TaxID=1392251 RepID=A0A9P4UDF4_9PLEO|nr:zf-PARP-domain-containing protein [Karstenula rhodostoma CBS 690.94]